MEHRTDIGILRKVLKKFSRYQFNQEHSLDEQVRARANILRHLHNFQMSIDEEVKKIQEWLLDVEPPVREYFTDMNEKVSVHKLPNGEPYIEVTNFQGGDHRAAKKQEQDRERSIAEYKQKKLWTTKPSSSLTAKDR